MPAQKERQNPNSGGGDDDDAGDDKALSEARQRAKRFLTIGDTAITRALTTPSEVFLKANRQKGGE